jgi:MinD superfamily P-loop ATPase
MIIGITGGKGGTGKSTVSTGLAFELSRKYKVVLVDSDVDCPNDHLLLNINQETVKVVKQRIPKFDLDKCTQCGACGPACPESSIVSVKGNYPIFNPKTCNGCGACVVVCQDKAISWDKKDIGFVKKGKLNDNLVLLSGEVIVGETLSEKLVESLMQEAYKLKEEADFIIIDTAAGTHCNVIRALEKVEKVFAVTEPTPLGAHDLELILKLVEKVNPEEQKERFIIINRDGVGDEKAIMEISKTYSTNIIARIPYSRDIVDAYTKGIPIVHTEIKKLAEFVIESKDV